MSLHNSICLLKLDKSIITTIVFCFISGLIFTQTETKILASDGNFGDSFGSSVSLENNRVIVGAESHDSNLNGIATGSTYVFDWDGSIWVETKLSASDASQFDRFGVSVDIDNSIVVGANGDDDNGNTSGSAYIYNWDGNNWIETKLSASDGDSSDQYGSSVSISGDRIVIGAPYDEAGGFERGSVYVYDWDGTNWNETKLTASDGGTSDLFGWDVSIDLDRIIVSAWQDNENGSDSGSAYIYDWDGTNWI